MSKQAVIGFKKAVVASLLLSAGTAAQATDTWQTNLTISMVRAVGDYQGTTYDNSFEIWFTTPLAWPAGSRCAVPYRVIVDAKNKHLIAAAYLALASGKKVNVNVDDNLPIRDGSCEVSFLDVIA